MLVVFLLTLNIKLIKIMLNQIVSDFKMVSLTHRLSLSLLKSREIFHATRPLSTKIDTIIQSNKQDESFKYQVNLCITYFIVIFWHKF